MKNLYTVSFIYSWQEKVKDCISKVIFKNWLNRLTIELAYTTIVPYMQLKGLIFSPGENDYQKICPRNGLHFI